MRKELILITREFPYGIGNETFLEAEIEILSKYFGRITIYPTKKQKSIRQVPNNVFVDNSICDLSFSKSYWLLKFFGSFYSYKTIFKYLFSVKGTSSLKYLFKYILSYLRYSSFAKKFFIENNGVLIYSYWYTSAVDAFLANRDKNTKIITRVHRRDLYEELSEIGFFPNRDITIGLIDKVYSISQDGVKYLSDKYAVNNVKLSRLGVFDKGAINKKYGENFSIVSVSNLIKIKRVDFIAESIAQFCIANPNIKVIWNHFGDGVELKKITNVVDMYALKNLEAKFNGRVNNSAIYRFYSESSVDVLINLSSSEGIPVSIMEANSFGISTIATDVGGVSEIVNSRNGHLLQSDPEIKDVVNALNLTYHNPLDRISIKENWESNFSAVKNYTEFAKELNSL